MTTMNTIEKAVSAALAIAADASHGYDQQSRWGPNYDCSSLVITVWEAAGVPIKSRGASYTGNMRPVFLACGFSDVTSIVDLNTGAGLERGDVLLNVANHTALCIGAGRIVQASSNENGGITGGASGDQTGREISERSYYNFPWDCVLRYSQVESAVDGSVGESVDAVGGSVGGSYTVQKGDTLWGVAEKALGSGMRYKELMEINGLSSEVIYPGQVLKLSAEAEEAPQESPDKCTARLPILRRGDISIAVRVLQSALRARGASIEIDGDFGSATENALQIVTGEKETSAKAWETLLS